jgi:ABC-type antimicrobial peptide transport system permease subunit
VAGETPAEVLARWREFQRDSDLVCSWGCYALNLFTALGGNLSPTRLDLRYMIKDLLKRNIGTLESFAGELDSAIVPQLGRGRAGLRLRLLAQVARGLCQGTLPTIG